MGVILRVQGLTEFSRNLKQLDGDLPKALRLALNEAGQLVVDRAVPKVPRRSGKAARSIKARSTRTQVRVSEGGNSARHMPWLDFGGSVGRHKSVHRPFLKRGRYLFPAYIALRDSGEFEDVLNTALLKVAAQAGVEVE